MAKTKTLNPSCKLCRREGEKLFLKGERCLSTKCGIVKRNFPPGMHGLLKQPRLTPFGQQLRAKQKAKRTYGIAERQFVNYYRKALTSKGDSELMLKRMLEMRLDNVVYRMGFVMARASARQMVNHGHFAVNGQKVNIPSYHVKVGDVVSIYKTAQNHPGFKGLAERLKNYQRSSWLSFDPETLSGKVLSLPTLDDVRDTIEAKQIIEFYSRF